MKVTVFMTFYLKSIPKNRMCLSSIAFSGVSTYYTGKITVAEDKMVRNINIKTRARNEFVDITEEVEKVLEETGVKDGICYIYVPHTTAGITINEGADPSVVKDIQAMLSKLVPHNLNYSHMEGNSDAHIKSTFVGVSTKVIIENGKPLLGTWQSIFFCEFDGPRSRKVYVKVMEA